MPKYNLETVRKAAKAGRIQYHGRRAGIEAAELGYQLKDIAACLASLTADEFSKTLQYEKGPAFDVYLTKFQHSNSEYELDELYVKLALIEGELTLTLASFHLQRFG